jgi:hypothetical protein
MCQCRGGRGSPQIGERGRLVQGQEKHSSSFNPCLPEELRLLEEEEEEEEEGEEEDDDDEKREEQEEEEGEEVDDDEKREE